MIPVDLLAEHSYELAFRACEGRRVAVLGGERLEISSLPPAARVELVGPEAISGDGNGALDAIVLVRGQHELGPAEEALEPVRQLAERGVPAVVGLPCGPDAAGARTTREALESLPGGPGGVTLVELRRASGSLIGPADGDAPIALAGEAEGEPDALLAFVNLDPGSLPPESLIRLAPASRRSLATMERAVRALERANRSLARPVASKRASAAASEIHRSTELERRLLHLHRESPWVTQPIRIARGLARRLRALRARLGR